MAPARIGQVTFDLTRYPVIVLALPERGDTAGVNAWYDRVEQLLGEARGPIALVHDLRQLDVLAVTALERRAVAQRTTRLSSHPRVGLVSADARIVPNSLMVGALTAITWLAGSVPWPQRTFSSEAEAIAWATSRIRFNQP